MWQDILGTSRYSDINRHEHTLWKTYSKQEDYLRELNKVFPGKYTEKDLLPE